eukprot:m.122765 g.122765  ORF g.122765 m.122765 type:complete len:168 (+) comp13434_c0_seq2:399-902(+)
MADGEDKKLEWMAMSAPGEEHAFLERLAGTWRSDVSLWWDPAGPPTKSAGTLKQEMILGGRFLRGEYTGDPSPKGSFEGVLTDGYDRAKKKYFGTWADNMGTGWMSFEGEVEENVRTSFCDYTCADGTVLKVKAVTTIVSPNEFRYETYNLQEVGEVKNMEITYIRQ